MKTVGELKKWLEEFDDDAIVEVYAFDIVDGYRNYENMGMIDDLISAEGCPTIHVDLQAWYEEDE